MYATSIDVVGQQAKPTVTAQLISAIKRQQEQRRKALSLRISCILYLLRQGLAFRGHSDIESDSIQLLKLRGISNRKWFSLICDETCDESTLERLCNGIRSVDDNYEIFEDILGLYELSRQDAPTIVEAICDVLTRCGLNVLDCRGQCYDGASNMSGVYGSVSALVLNQQPKAMYVYCTSHSLDWKEGHMK
ncbi:unnamed protein product [Rotaria sp. Silwood2]|nr:unnamed protein product [Rotaria sp. Silwood2]CAF4665002.1 unnamed protein product [Rotaria sp. Silwood2]